MNFMGHIGTRTLGLAIIAGFGVCACGDDDGGPTTTTSATGGSSSVAGSSATSGGASTNGGSSATGGTSNSSGGSSATTGGVTTAGTSATATAATGGSVASSGGSTSAGGSATTGTGGTAATGGTSSSSGGSSSGGSSANGGSTSTGGTLSSGGTSTNTGGLTGTGGGSATNCAVLYDFEGIADDLEGWTADTGIALGTDSTAAVTGSHALKATIPDIAEGTSVSLSVSPTMDAELWPGSVVTMHVMIPQGTSGIWLQAFTQSNSWTTFDTTGNSAVTVNPGAWTSWTYTIPDTLPGGLQALGVQIGVNAGGHFSAGDVYVDSISACAGSAVCSGNGIGVYDWENAGSEDGWTIDGNADPADTEIAQSLDLAVSGLGSLKVTFDNLPANAARRIVIDKPNAYCGQVVTYNVYVPSDFGADIELQPFSNIDNWVWNGGLSVTPAPGAWNTITYTLPQISSLGLQRLGLQISSAATAFNLFRQHLHRRRIVGRLIRTVTRRSCPTTPYLKPPTLPSRAKLAPPRPRPERRRVQPSHLLP